MQVEATKFTEVGFHGRDVDQIIRDLVDNAITMVRQRQRHAKRSDIQAAVDRRIIDALCGESTTPGTRVTKLITSTNERTRTCSWSQAAGGPLSEAWGRSCVWAVQHPSRQEQACEWCRMQGEHCGCAAAVAACRSLLGMHGLTCAAAKC